MRVREIQSLSMENYCSKIWNEINKQTEKDIYLIK